jgi:nucleotide-binding universal stress UspA family protein
MSRAQTEDYLILQIQEALLKNILVATDGSASSQRAVLQAIELAKANGAGLFVVNVVDAEPGNAYREFAEVELNEHATALQKALPLMNAPEGIGVMAALRMLDTQSHAVDLLVSERILDAAERAAMTADIATVKRVSVVGDTASEIVKAAAELDADLIVMGRRGRSPVAELLLGSVTQKVLHRTRKSVMVVS